MMKILLFGEYSNVHATLAKGLRQRGHSVTVVSDGDWWKGYPRDIDITRGGTDWWHTLHYLWRISRLIPTFRGYDIVQIINPMMLELKAERQMWAYRMLRKNNRRMILGAYGMDHYWVRAGCDCKTFRYSDFNLGKELRVYEAGEREKRDWLNGAKGILNKIIANDADNIVTGLYEYDVAYRLHFPGKTVFIPMPIDIPREEECAPLYKDGERIRFFIGIQRTRSEYKGTDVMLRALHRLQNDFPERMEIVEVENVPFDEYRKLLSNSHVLLDQLYSYTPAMNALLAMSKRLIVVGGGEAENYEILGEKDLHPIINVRPVAAKKESSCDELEISEEDIYTQIRDRLLMHPEQIATLQEQSRMYVIRHHAIDKIATEYEQLYEKQNDLHLHGHSAGVKRMSGELAGQNGAHHP